MVRRARCNAHPKCVAPDSLTGLSTRSRFILAEGSSHYLNLDAPELVAESILSAVNDVRRK